MPDATRIRTRARPSVPAYSITMLQPGPGTEGWRRLGKRRRAELKRLAASALQTGEPFPPFTDIAARWKTDNTAIHRHMERMRAAGEIATERRGRRLYVVEVAG